MARYDDIGDGYSATRREDPRLRDLIHSALEDSASVLNVGAGTGSYEPRDRLVIAVEPSVVMLGQRGAAAAPSIRASASPLPLRDDCVDAAMAILTVHHWDDQLESGLRELRRVTRGPVLIVTIDVAVCAQMWLLRDYLPEAAELDRATFPDLTLVKKLLGGRVEIEPVPISRDTPDWTLASFWAHPERVLDPAARNGTSGFSRQPPAVVDRVISAVRLDLESGEWDRRHGHLREIDALDVGLRLIVAHPAMSDSAAA